MKIVIHFLAILMFSNAFAEITNSEQSVQEEVRVDSESRVYRAGDRMYVSGGMSLEIWSAATIRNKPRLELAGKVEAITYKGWTCKRLTNLGRNDAFVDLELRNKNMIGNISCSRKFLQ